MHIFLSIVLFIVTLSVIIIIHEFGHFLLARRAGILCYEFSIGMGPKIWSKKKGETVYSIRAIPIGGYVQMAGEEGTGILLDDDIEIGFDADDNVITRVYLSEDGGEFRGKLISHEIYKEMYLEIQLDEEIKKYDLIDNAMFVDEKGNETQAAPYDRCFESKTLLQRFLAIFAGPFMNFVLGIIVLIIYSFMVGTPNYNSKVIGKALNNSTKAVVVKKNNSSVENETLSLEGFEIDSINEKNISSWNDLENLSLTITNDNYRLRVTGKKDNNEYEVLIDPYIYLGSLGLYLDLSDDYSNGIKVYLYCVNAENGGVKADSSKNEYSIIKKIDDVEINNPSDLIKFSKENVGNNITMTLIDMDNNEYEVKYKMYDQKTVEKLNIGLYEISYGITPTYGVNFGKCLVNSFKYFKNDALSVFNTLGLLFTSKDVGVKNLSGPVGIYKLVSSTVSQGAISYVSLLGLLTINIGIVNLLPVPALDGGRIIFLIYELITRRKPNKKFENALNGIMFILLMALFVFITFNDIFRF